MTRIRTVLLPLFACLLAACGSSAGSPEQAVQDYLQAIVSNYETSVVNVSCSEWEEQARLESAAYVGVEC